MAQQLTFDLPSRAALGRADFLVSPSNALALARLDDWRNWPGAKFVLSGPPASGKSHLARVWALSAGALVLPAKALLTQAPDQLAAGQHLALEDCDDLAGQSDFETALFHLFNLTRAENRALLLTGQRPLGHWDVSLPDLKSRLLSLDTIGLSAPDDTLLSGLLLKLFSDRQLRVSPEVISFLVPRIERSAATAMALVEGLDEFALTRRRSITTKLAAQFLDKWNPPRA